VQSVTHDVSNLHVSFMFTVTCISQVMVRIGQTDGQCIMQAV